MTEKTAIQKFLDKVKAVDPLHADLWKEFAGLMVAAPSPAPGGQPPAKIYSQAEVDAMKKTYQQTIDSLKAQLPKAQG